MTNNVYLKEDDYKDTDRIEDFNNEYLRVYPNYKPFATKENFDEFLKNTALKKTGHR